MDFKISDTNKGKKSLIYDGFILYRIDGVLKCGDISWRCTNKKCKGRLRKIQCLTNGSTIVESRYLFYGFDNEIRL